MIRRQATQCILHLYDQTAVLTIHFACTEFITSQPLSKQLACSKKSLLRDTVHTSQLVPRMSGARSAALPSHSTLHAPRSTLHAPRSTLHALHYTAHTTPTHYSGRHYTLQHYACPRQQKNSRRTALRKPLATPWPLAMTATCCGAGQQRRATRERSCAG